ncbi:hypothetical protein PHMEG_0003385 [Phytophthora megakarya]|uniref:RxLR effector protein n=1 Tax=Phytophthora megakarya TaxID=4795 RepID=A0A225WY75_9STRA|nr:hypothetical protein PHMEG_0003385 [Phytophthora megakarya]
MATVFYAWILSSISSTNAVPNNNPTTQIKQDRLQNLLSAAPSLRLRIMLERENMEIHGQPVFDVFLKPNVSGTELRYDGFSTFIEGDTKFTSIVEIVHRMWRRLPVLRIPLP